MIDLETLILEIKENKNSINEAIVTHDFPKIQENLELNSKILQNYRAIFSNRVENNENFSSVELLSLAEYTNNNFMSVFNTYFKQDSIINGKLHEKINTATPEGIHKELLINSLYDILKNTESVFNISKSHPLGDTKENKKEDLQRWRKTASTKFKSIFMESGISSNHLRPSSTSKNLISAKFAERFSTLLNNNFEVSHENYLQMNKDANIFIDSISEVPSNTNFVDLLDLISGIPKILKKSDKYLPNKLVDNEVKLRISSSMNEYKHNLLDLFIDKIPNEKKAFEEKVQEMSDKLYSNRFGNIKENYNSLKSYKDLLIDVSEKLKQTQKIGASSKINLDSELKSIDELIGVAEIFKGNRQIYDELTDNFLTPEYNSEFFKRQINGFLELNNNLKQVTDILEFDGDMTDYTSELFSEMEENVLSAINYKNKKVNSLLSEYDSMLFLKDEITTIKNQLARLDDGILTTSKLDSFNNKKLKLDDYISFLGVLKDIEENDHLLIQSKYFKVKHLESVELLKRTVKNKSEKLSTEYKDTINNFFEEHIVEVYSTFNKSFITKTNQIYSELKNKDSSLEKLVGYLGNEIEELGPKEELFKHLEEEGKSNYELLEKTLINLQNKENSWFYKKFNREKKKKKNDLNKRKIFVLDTNVFINNPYALNCFQDNEIIIPIEVIQELDKHKNTSAHIKYPAREAEREIEKYKLLANQEGKTLRQGVANSEGGTISTYVRKGKFEDSLLASLKELPFAFRNERDLEIITAFKEVAEANKDAEVIMCSDDLGMRLIVDGMGYKSQTHRYEEVKGDVEDMFKGYRFLEASPLDIKHYKTTNKLDYDISDMIHNEFLIVKNSETGNNDLLFRKVNGGLLEEIASIEDAGDIQGIKPRNYEQHLALTLLKDETIDLYFFSGPAGTGKTLLALASGLQTLEDDEGKKLVLVKALEDMGKELGILPGDVQEKLRPYMNSYRDNLERILTPLDELKKQDNLNHPYTKAFMDTYKQENGEDGSIIAFEPAATIRGRTLPNIDLILDEAQNLSGHEVKSCITRIGDNSRMILMGDPDQIDNKYLTKQSNGLSVAMEATVENSLSENIYNAAVLVLNESERSNISRIYGKIL